MDFLKSIGDTADRIFLHPFTLKIGWGLMNLFSYWPVVFRATLYFLIGGLPTWIKTCKELHANPESFDRYLVWGAAGEILYQGCVALRAYFDGSAQRLMPKGNGGNTGFFTRKDH